MRAGALAALAAGRVERQPGLDVVLHLGGGRADEEEDAQQREGRGPRVQRVDAGGQAGGQQAEWGEAVA